MTMATQRHPAVDELTEDGDDDVGTLRHRRPAMARRHARRHPGDDCQGVTSNPPNPIRHEPPDVLVRGSRLSLLNLRRRASDPPTLGTLHLHSRSRRILVSKFTLQAQIHPSHTRYCMNIHAGHTPLPAGTLTGSHPPAEWPVPERLYVACIHALEQVVFGK